MFAAPLEVLSPDAISSVHDQAMRILEEIGVEVGSEAGIELLRGAGQTVDGTRVRLDRGFVMEQVSKAPASFTLRPRNPARELRVGGGSMVLTPVGGSPFCADLERGRRDGTLDAYVQLTQMAHAADVIGCLQSGVTEAADLSEISRYLDLDYACLRWSDKPYICYGTSGEKAADAVTMAAMACGGLEAIRETPAIIGIVNPNSPLVWDSLMVDCILAWAAAGQPVAMTPFMLAGATAPVSLAAGLSLQIAEALSGVALAQLVRPGTPCLYGSFFSGVDMRSGGPALGMPEGVLATLAGGQLARHYGLPYRGGGGLCSGNAVDAQSAYETSMALWATYHSGSDLVLHAAGWLEGGLTASFEKFVLDVEVLKMFERLRDGVVVDAEHLAYDAIRDEGPAGMFLASPHTLEHYREWLHISPLFRSQAHPTWLKQGAPTADQAAVPEWKKLLGTYEDPGIDDAVDAELQEFMARRKAILDA
jgi:trimethylamine--corrinoid protein Co-methyltransferase